jgi:hypothetical protein
MPIDKERRRQRIRGALQNLPRNGRTEEEEVRKAVEAATDIVQAAAAMVPAGAFTVQKKPD